MKSFVWLLAAALILCSVLLLRACGPGGDGALARLSLDDGSEYLLTQEWHGLSEPYTVEFWFRPSGGAWGWCYVDHEATRWRSAELRHDAVADSIQVLRDDKLEAALFRERQSFWLARNEAGERRAPQELRAPPRYVEAR